MRRWVVQESKDILVLRTDFLARSNIRYETRADHSLQQETAGMKSSAQSHLDNKQ